MKLLHEAINPRSRITQRALQCFGAPLSQFVALAQQSLTISFKRVVYSCKLRHEESLTVGHLAAACFSACLAGAMAIAISGSAKKSAWHFCNVGTSTAAQSALHVAGSPELQSSDFSSQHFALTTFMHRANVALFVQMAHPVTGKGSQVFLSKLGFVPGAQSWHTTPVLLAWIPWHAWQSTWGPATPPTRPLPAGQTRQELEPAVGLYWLLTHGTQATVPDAPLEPGCFPAGHSLGGGGGGGGGHCLTAAFMVARASSPAAVSQETRLLSTYIRSRALR